MNWYIGVLKKYAVFQGRARRKEYWMFVLINFLISWALGFIEGMTGIGGDSQQPILSTIYTLAVLIPSLAVGVRRMHDSGHSGWWIIVPFVNLYFAVVNGTAGDNEYGPDPKAGEAA